MRDRETTDYLKSDAFYVGKELDNGCNALASEDLKHKEKSYGYWKAILNLRYEMCAHSFLNLTLSGNYIVRFCYYFTSRNSWRAS